MIPRLIHYVWLADGPGDRPTPFHEACRAQTLALHPGFGVCDWTDAGLLDDPALSPLRDKLGTAWKLYDGLPTARSDLMRLCELYVHGGVYCDWDVWAVRPFDEFLDEHLLLGCNSFDPFVVGEHVIGAEPLSPRVLAVLKYFCSGPRCPNEKYSPHLNRFVYHFGWEAKVPDVFCPHLRDAPATDLYRVTPVTHAIHCWSPLGYDLGRLREVTDAAPPPAAEPKYLEICT